MRDIPTSGQLVQHYKGGWYTVICAAKHSETGDALIIYQADIDDMIYARPLEMFLSEVPADKENPTGQKYRFENI